jgi:hypothetical protein
MGIREEVYFEGGPHIGDLITNIFIGLTVVGLPLTVGHCGCATVSAIAGFL